MGIIHEFEFQLSGAPDQIFGPVRIFNTRQLDQNTSISLSADIGLSDPELVDTIADGFQRLIDG